MKNKYIIPVVYFLAGGVLAYYAMPTKVKIEKVMVEVEHKKAEQDTVIVEKTNKDGSTTKTTVIKTRTETEIKKDSKIAESKETYKTQYNISVLAGVDVNNLANPAIFGIHAQKQFFGPIGLGLFVFTNKTAGLSVGFQF